MQYLVYQLSEGISTSSSLIEIPKGTQNRTMIVQNFLLQVSYVYLLDFFGQKIYYGDKTDILQLLDL